MAASLSCIFSCTLASLLLPFWGSLSLRFCSEMASAFGFGIGRFVLGLFLVVGSPVKQDKMLSVFVFCFLLGFVLS